MIRRKQLRPAARTRLAIETLEARDVPASSLTIDGGANTSITAAVNVSASTVGTVTTFTATGPGAFLDVDAIEFELNAGNDVVIDTGVGGAGDAGNISWVWNASPDDLNYAGAATRSLTLKTNASSLSGDISITDVYMYLGQKVDVTLDTSAPLAGTKNINLLGAAVVGFFGGDEAASFTLIAGTGDITMQPYAQIATSTGDISLSADSMTASGFLSSISGNVIVNSALTVGLLTANAANVTLAGTVDSGDLYLTAVNSIILGGAVGATTPLSSLNLDSGTVSFGTNNISATTINVNGGTLGTGTGTITGDINVGSGYPYGGVVSAFTIVGNVTVSNDGKLAPGGVGTVGTMNIDGDLTFSGGDLEIDLGVTSDVVKPTGVVSINAGLEGSRLLIGTPSHVFANTTAVKIVDATGTLTGEFLDSSFDEIPDGTNILLNLDAATVNYVAGPPGVLTLTKAAGSGGTFDETEFDGTGYTVKLTGGGDLVEANGSFMARNTTTKSNIIVTTKANASDDLIDLDSIVIGGPLGAIKAPKANLFGSLKASGTVKSITLNEVDGSVTLGGTATDKTSITVSDMNGDFSTPGILSSLTVKRSATADVNAAEVGTVKVGDILSGVWTVTPNGVKSITAGAIDNLDLTAKFLGSLSVKGTKTLSGDISGSSIKLTGDDGTNAKNGLKKLTAKGSVVGTTFDVEAGNVGSVTVGRFIDSDLFLNYTETLAGFNVGPPTGGFFGASVFTLGSFTTTAKTIGDVNNPFNASFSGSRIAANTIGKVKLSGVNSDNGSDAFGIKFVTLSPKMDVKVAGVKLTSALVGGAAIDGDFFFIKVV